MDIIKTNDVITKIVVTDQDLRDALAELLKKKGLTHLPGQWRFYVQYDGTGRFIDEMYFKRTE